MNKRRAKKLTKSLVSLSIGLAIGVAMIPVITTERQKTVEAAERSEHEIVQQLKQRDKIIERDKIIDLSEKQEEAVFVITTAASKVPEKNEGLEELPEVAEELPEQKSTKPWVEYTSEDVKLLGNVIYAEEAMMFELVKMGKLTEQEATMACKLCGSVLLHRVENNYRGYGADMESQVRSGQYARRTLQMLDAEAPQKYYNFAEDLLKNGPLGPSSMIFQAEYEQGTEVYAHIYNQYFCLN